jgi:hypothetical protein
MKRLYFFVLSASLCVFLIASVVQSQEKQGAQQPDRKSLTSNQVLMREKLVHMNDVLEGLTLEQFDQVDAAAEKLRMISVATGWHVSDQTPRYQRLSKNFQEQAIDLKRHAQEKNTDAATLDLVRLNLTCTQCHQHMRELATRGR